MPLRPCAPRNEQRSPSRRWSRSPCCSPEAAAARAAFVGARPRLHETIASSGSGRELITRGWADDVATSAALDVTDRAARLVDDAYVRS